MRGESTTSIRRQVQPSLGVLLKQLGMTARQLLRTGEAEYQSLGLDDPR
jgi:arsenate reductase-like glutaredoxin family protein